MKRLCLIACCFALTSHARSLYIPRIVVNQAFIKNLHKRGTSYPFICGDTFRWMTRLHVDEFRHSFDPTLVKEGDIVFVASDYLKFFFRNVHPHIAHKYILVTHNSIMTIPGIYEHYLKSDKLIAWFGHNIGKHHPKLHPLPLGIANRYWPHGNTKLIQEYRDMDVEKKYLVYINVSSTTNATARDPMLEYFETKKFCTFASRKPFEKYLYDLKQSYFVISPPGKGIDCHRTYEALLMGAIPIVLSSPIDAVFEDLPVVIVQSWDEITEKFLHEKLIEFEHKEFNLEKLFADYWINQILDAKKDVV